MMARNNVLEAGDPQRSPLDFNCFPSIAAPLQTSGRWHSWAGILTFLIDTLVFTMLAPSRALERQRQWWEESKRVTERLAEIVFMLAKAGWVLSSAQFTCFCWHSLEAQPEGRVLSAAQPSE